MSGRGAGVVLCSLVGENTRQSSHELADVPPAGQDYDPACALIKKVEHARPGLRKDQIQRMN